jgi:hypothetical protein
MPAGRGSDEESSSTVYGGNPPTISSCDAYAYPACAGIDDAAVAARRKGDPGPGLTGSFSTPDAEIPFESVTSMVSSYGSSRLACGAPAKPPSAPRVRPGGNPETPRNL